MLDRIMRILKKTMLWLVFLTVLLLGSFMLFARFYPINLTPIATKVLSWVAPETQFTFDELWFTHDGKFTIQAKNVVFEGIDNDNIGAIKSLSLRLANRSIALLNPSPKHIVIDGIYYEGEVRSEERLKDQNRIALNQVEALLGRLKWLKTITINDVNIILTDKKANIHWALKNGSGKGTYYSTEGLNLNIEGQLAQNDEKLAPAVVRLRTNPKSHASALNLSLDSLNMGWFKPYMPENMREIISGKINLTVGSEWQPKKGWQPLLLSARLASIGVNLPVAFREEKHFDTLDIQGEYNIAQDTFLLNTFRLNKGENQLLLNGSLEKLTAQPSVNASGTLFAKHTKDIWPLLPDQKMKNTLPFLAENASATIVKPAQISLNGPLHQIFQCEVSAPCSHLKMVATISPGSWIKPLKKAPRVESLKDTQMIWEEGALSFSIPKAKMGEQKLSNVKARIENIQTPPENPRALIIRGDMAGELEPALKIVKPMFDVSSPQMLSGLHSTHIALDLPIVRGVSPTIKAASLTVVTQTARAALVGGIKGESTVFTESNFKLQNNKLAGQGKVNYIEDVVDYNLNFDLKNKALKLNFDGKVDVSKLPIKLPAEQLEIKGRTPTKVSVQKANQSAPLVFDVQSDFTHTNIEVTPLNWQHQIGEDLNLKAQGTWDQKNKTLNTELFSLIGKDIEVAGQFYYPTRKPITEMTLQLSPVVLGNNNFNIEYLSNNLKVSGSSIDLSRLLTQKRKKQKVEWPKTLNADINVQRIWFKNGVLKELEVNLERDHDKWQRANLNGQMANLVPFNLRYEPVTDGYEMNVRTEDLGMLLSTVGISEKVRGGQLLGRLSLDQNQNNGRGMITLNNARFIKAPMLVQLVSLLSLEELISGGTGIDFKEGAFPITKTGGSYRLKKAYLTGPSMALKFNGEIIPNDQYINIKGEFIPTAGINRAISSIPILGNILTGSQDGLFVAEFKSKGNWQNPETSVNPLTSVTPGIVKDFFRIITGKDEE